MCASGKPTMARQSNSHRLGASSCRVGIVIPTLGTRPHLLRKALESIRLAGAAHVQVVAPAGVDLQRFVDSGLLDQIEVDPQAGLAAAVNMGISKLPQGIEFVNWLGDDDLLMPGSIEVVVRRLMAPDRPVMVFGGCEYIDRDGRHLWTNRSGRWTVPLLRFGPDLIPQPGALFRRSAFDEAGGLAPELGWAFDLDLWIKLSRVGKLVHVPTTLAAFRWHPLSLSVNQRRASVKQASTVRVSHLPVQVRGLSYLWELPLRRITLLAGTAMSRRSRRRSARGAPHRGAVPL